MTMITPSYLGETIEYSSLHACRSTLEDPTLDAASEDPNVQGVRRFLERVASEPRVSATALQTVGSKGYDGFAIALVLEATGV